MSADGTFCNKFRAIGARRRQFRAQATVISKLFSPVNGCTETSRATAAHTSKLSGSNAQKLNSPRVERLITK